MLPEPEKNQRKNIFNLYLMKKALIKLLFAYFNMLYVSNNKVLLFFTENKFRKMKSVQL